MFTLETSICVDVLIDVAWREMARIDDVDLWVDQIADSFCKTVDNRGLGAERVCVMTNGIEVTEKFIHWDEGKAFTYKVYGKGFPGMKSAQNAWTFEDMGDKTMIRSVATVELKWALLGKLIEPFIHMMFKRDMPRIAASLKYFVENGVPYEGNNADLPKAASFC